MERKKMENEKTIAELEAELKELTANKVIAMKKEVEEDEAIKAIAKAKTDEEDAEVAFNKKMEDYLTKYGITPKVEDPTGEPSGDRAPEVHENIVFAQKLAQAWALPGLGEYESMAQDYVANGVVAFTNYSADCPTTTRAEWHAECFADLMWEAVICKSDFLDKNITVKGLDFQAGCGGVTQLRYINHATPSKDWEAMAPCTCMTCVSNVLATHTMTMEQYGDFHVICDVDAFTIGSSYQTMVMRAMMTRASERIDHKIAGILSTATPTYTATLDIDCAGAKTYGRTTDGACCDYGTNLFEKIIDLEAAMRDAGYFGERDPVLILNPNVAVHLKYRSGLSTPMYWYNNIEMEGTKIAKIGNIEVIESCNVTDCNGTASSPQAYLIDPSRALGEAWGKRPTIKTDADPIECEQLKIVYTAWADFAVLDSAAIGKILNPA